MNSDNKGTKFIWILRRSTWEKFSVFVMLTSGLRNVQYKALISKYQSYCLFVSLHDLKNYDPISQLQSNLTVVEVFQRY